MRIWQLRHFTLVTAFSCAGLANLSPGNAQAPQPRPAAVTALMVSDIHFDPLHDPALAKELAAAPVEKWRAILSSPASANQKAAFEALQEGCQARGVDTPYALLASSLKAMRAQAGDARFMTVSGDLVVHGFPCRYGKLFPSAAPGEYTSFVVKTIDFVVSQLRSAFPRMPVYVALGNNDSGCGDYELDEGGTDASAGFLARTGRSVADALPGAQRLAAEKEFSDQGGYSVRMAAPIENTRLIVLDDVFLSGKYTTCGGKADPAPAAAQLAWLGRQLDAAQAAGEKVWVMGHIPPGIDPYSTVAKMRNVCGGKSPVEFLANDGMAEVLEKHAAPIRLAIFAHTHMDEMRLLQAEDGAAATGSVAVKMVASISPVDGNIPSFTIARVDPATAVLKDYTVVKATDQEGSAWTTEYSYGAAYHQAEFSPAALRELMGGFAADKEAKTDASQAYIRNYFVGDMSREISPFWPEYVCALDHVSAKGFAGCVCAGAAAK